MGCRGQYNKAVAQTLSSLCCKADAYCFLNVASEVFSSSSFLFSPFPLCLPSHSVFRIWVCFHAFLSHFVHTFAHKSVLLLTQVHLNCVFNLPLRSPKLLASQQVTITVIVLFTSIKQGIAAVSFFPEAASVWAPSACGQELRR